ERLQVRVDEAREGERLVLRRRWRLRFDRHREELLRLPLGCEVDADGAAIGDGLTFELPRLLVVNPYAELGAGRQLERDLTVERFGIVTGHPQREHAIGRGRCRGR